MTFECIRYEIEGVVATVYLNRPPYNPLNRQMYEELSKLFSNFEYDRDVKAVILTGEGKKAFAAGADIHEMANYSNVEMLEMCQISRLATSQIEQLSKPVIAAINGPALGGGCELTLACDFRYCSDHSKFSLPEINLGIIPGGGGTQRLQRIIGQAKAKHMLFLGEMISSQEALEIGLVDKVVPQESLIGETEKLAQKLAEKPSLAMQMMKLAVNSGANMDLESALKLEFSCFGNVFTSEDRKEGMSAFSEKRQPNFVGR